MTLLDACEPLFQKVCELNRMGRNGAGTMDFQTLRREITGQIDAVRRVILGDPNLDRHWNKLEMPVLFFVDSMISESAISAAADWNKHRMAYDYKELAGDEKFFDLLREELKDTSSEASVRIGFYYTCIGVGFTGYFAGGPGHLRSLMIEMIKRVDPTVLAEDHLRLCPEAYENLDLRDLREPPPIRASILLAFFLALSAIFLAVNIFLFSEATLQLRSDLARILSHALENTTLKSLLPL